MSIKSILSKYSMSMVLVVAILAVSLWMFFGLFVDIGNVSREVHSLEVKYSALNQKSVDENELLKNLNDAAAALKEYELKFPPAIEQENTLRTVQTLEQESGFKIVSMNFDPLQYDTLNQSAPGNSSSSQSKSGISPPVPGMGMKIPIRTQFTAYYAELKQFVTLLNEAGQKIGFREIQMNTDRDRTIRGSLILEFYGFAPETPEEGK